MSAAPLVLIVEDSAGYARLVELFLEEAFGAGVSTRHAATLAAGLAALEGVDCVLLDLGLPDERGFDGLGRLRAACPELPVVVLSGRDAPGTEAEVLAHGAAAFVPKGAEPALLGPAVTAALALRA